MTSMAKIIIGELVALIKSVYDGIVKLRKGIAYDIIKRISRTN